MIRKSTIKRIVRKAIMNSIKSDYDPMEYFEENLNGNALMVTLNNQNMIDAVSKSGEFLPLESKSKGFISYSPAANLQTALQKYSQKLTGDDDPVYLAMNDLIDKSKSAKFIIIWVE